MTTNNNSNVVEVSSSMIFCGLVAGYQGEGNTATPENAADAVKAALAARGVDVQVSPAVCVYHTEWGCPVGGEPVGAYSREGRPEQILTEAEQLRKDLNQSTLSVGLPEGFGSPTVGFSEMIPGTDLKEAGARWQQAAAKQMAMTGVYVSCGIAQLNGMLVVSAEANPAFTSDLELWQQTAQAICDEVGVKITSFVNVGFNYLR